jgi:hypothetical protein
VVDRHEDHDEAAERVDGVVALVHRRNRIQSMVGPL